MLLFGLISITALAGERLKWTDGHGDLSVGYNQGDWDWGIWVNSPVDEVIVSLNDKAKNTIPDIAGFEFLGNVGDPVWIAPQVDREGVIFFGMNSSATPQGTFERNRFDLMLTSVEGPGDFLTWITGGAGSIEVGLNSRDGIDVSDRIDVPAPGHFHQNWGFTSPGTYHVGFTGEGILAGQSALNVSDEEVYRFAVNVFDRGELDMEVAYEDGEWELVLLDEVNEKEIEAGDAALHAGPSTWQAVPSDPAFGFLGNPGDSIYILPQDEKEGILFLGIAGDEIESGVFENDQVSLNLSTVEGPGSVYLYSTDAFGTPSKYFDSGDGISSEDHFPVSVGGHSHQNWAFSSPGIYRVGLNASGVLVDGTSAKSDDTVFLFEVFGPTIFGAGELDLEVAYEDGEWELIGLDEVNEREINADELVILGSSATQTIVPENPAFGFLGTAGDVVNVLPQEETEGVIFLGIAGDEIESGIFVGDAVELKLVSSEGPGHVSLYAVDAFGSPEVFFNTADGISGNDAFPVNVGGHSHQNWGFTQPGVYRVGLQASGDLAGNAGGSQSDVAIFTFNIQGTGASTDTPRVVFDRGELDMEVAYEDGEWELVLLDEVNEKEIEAGDAALHAGPSTWQAVPSDPAFGFLGNPGDSIYILPQDEKEGILFLGIAGDEIESGVFENDQVSLNLSTVEGPGSVYLYSTDAFGTPSKYFDSGDGISSEDHFPVSVGGHSHQNWAFSSPGIYRVGLNASGVLVDGTSAKSDDTVFLFEVFGPTIFGAGELDLEVAYEDGEWELIGLDEVNEREINADELVILGSSATQTIVPENPAFGFLGTAGDVVNVLPQEETEGVIFLGIAGDEIESGIFVGDAVELKLVSSEGPGHVSLYAVDAFGSPEVFFNTADGISGNDAFPVNVGGHSHQNWGFTQPGVYRVGLQASGDLAGNAGGAQSDVAIFTFNIQGTGASTDTPRLVFDRGELDMEVAYEDGVFELVLLDEVNNLEIEAADVLLTGTAATLEPVPNSKAFGFLGNPGERIFILPQDEQEGVLFLGIAGDEIPAGEFRNDSVGLNLVQITGPGDVFLYATDAFGTPEAFYNSADGIDESDVFPVKVGGHSHQNWGFSAAGEYEVILQASGVKAGNEESVVSEPVAFFFHVIEPEIFHSGELDMEVAYEDGAWELVLLDEVNEREVAPDESLLQGGAAVMQSVPNNAAFSFLGSVGDTAWVLPQEETEDVLFLGIAGDEIEAGIFENDAVDLQLKSVRGPGDVSLYAVDAFGAPVVYMNSGDGIDANDVFPVKVGGHSHQNWGFTAPGIYKIALQAAGTLFEGSESIESQTVEFTFELLDGSSSISLVRNLNDSIKLRWATSLGANYQLQSRSALSGGEWGDVGEVMSGTGEVMEFEVPVMTDVDSLFYRLWIVPSATP